jgi:dihydroxyacetone kinase-like protein
MGVALTSCTVPAAGKPTFELAGDEIEMGVGIHGEPGRRRVKHKSADDIAGEMMTAIVGDLGAKAGSEVLLLVNGYGGTPAMELYLMFEPPSGCSCEGPESRARWSATTAPHWRWRAARSR